MTWLNSSRLAQPRQLAVAAQQEEQLRLERRAGFVLVEIGEKRVLAVLEDGGGVDADREALGQRRLAHADGPFDSQVPVIHGAGSIPTASRAWQGSRAGLRCAAVRIERLELRVLRLPLVRFFETSFGRVYDRTFLLVRADGEGVTAWGECVADDNPYYSSETVETAWHIITEFLAPLVLGVAFAHPRDVFPAHAPRSRPPDGQGRARDGGVGPGRAAGRRAAVGAARRHADARSRRACRSASRTSLEQLVERVGAELADGYRRIKIKVKPGWDLDAAAAIRTRFGAIPLMVDANAAYSLADAAHLADFDAFDLMMIEQPLDYDDIVDHAGAAAAA